MPETVYGPLADENELARYIEIGAQAFGDPLERVREWIESARPKNARVLRVRGEVVGGVLVNAARQRWHGRWVPFGAVAGVCVAPEARGQGAAREIMLQMLEETRAAGLSISGLYPSTETLYRSAGYAQAGGSFGVRLRTREMPPLPRPLTVRRIRPADAAAIDELQRTAAERGCGPLERSDVFWAGIRTPLYGPVEGYVFVGEATAEGYVYCRQKPGAGLRVLDSVTLTSDAVLTLGSFLRDHRSLLPEVTMKGLPGCGLLGVLPEKCYSLTLNDHWMLRIADVPAALAERGYPAQVTATLDLDVSDDLIAANAGRLRMTVEGGRATVEPGGDGSVRLDQRALASLYTGFKAPGELVLAGLLAGGEEDLARLGAVFAGPQPWLPENF